LTKTYKKTKIDKDCFQKLSFKKNLWIEKLYVFVKLDRTIFDNFKYSREEITQMNDFLQNLRNGQAEKQRPQKTRKSYDNSYQYTNSRFQSFGGYQNSRNQQPMKRSSMQQPHIGNQVAGDDNLVTSMLAEAIESLSIHIESLAKNQDYMIKAQEKTAMMLERQVNAVERILNHLNIAPLKEEQPHKEAEAKEVFEHHYVTSPKSETEQAELSEFPGKVAGNESNQKSGQISDKVSNKTSMEAIKPEKPVIRRRKKIVVKKSSAAVSTDGKLLGREAVMDIIHTMRAEGATFDQVAVRLVELGQPTFSGRGEWHAQTIHRLCNKR
jgi:hypothetical protein